MNKFGLRSLATVAVATLAFGGLGATAASAKTSVAPASFVGSYKIRLTAGGPTERGTFEVDADGTAPLGGGITAHWKSNGPKFTLKFRAEKISETLVGRQSGRGIATQKNPGTFTETIKGLGSVTGTWYAVKTS